MHCTAPAGNAAANHRCCLQVAALLNERYKIGDELKRSIRDDILRLIEAKTYRCAQASGRSTCVTAAGVLLTPSQPRNSCSSSSSAASEQGVHPYALS